MRLLKWILVLCLITQIVKSQELKANIHSQVGFDFSPSIYLKSICSDNLPDYFIGEQFIYSKPLSDISILYMSVVTMDQDIHNWQSEIIALYLDEYGRLREDTDQDGDLTDNDLVIEFNEGDQSKFIIERFSKDGEKIDIIGLSELNPILQFDKNTPINNQVDALNDQNNNLEFGAILQNSLVVNESDETLRYLNIDDSYEEYLNSTIMQKTVLYSMGHFGRLNAFDVGLVKDSKYQMNFDRQSQLLWTFNSVSDVDNLTINEQSILKTNLSYYDVKIFNEDSTYINGWGGILSVLAINDDGTLSVEILDVTNPNEKPKLLKQFQIDYSNSQSFQLPDTKMLISKKKNNETNWSIWFYENILENDAPVANLIKIDLRTLSIQRFSLPDFVGNIVGIENVDINLDGFDDVLYVSANQINAQGKEMGQIYNFDLNENEITNIASFPSAINLSVTAFLKESNLWLVQNVGKVNTVNEFKNDHYIAAISQSINLQGKLNNKHINFNQLLDVTDISLSSENTDGLEIISDDEGNAILIKEDLENYIVTKGGWMRELFDQFPHMMLKKPLIHNQNLIYETLQITSDSCLATNNSSFNSQINSIDIVTGLTQSQLNVIDEYSFVSKDLNSLNPTNPVNTNEIGSSGISSSSLMLNYTQNGAQIILGNLNKSHHSSFIDQRPRVLKQTRWQQFY